MNARDVSSMTALIEFLSEYAAEVERYTDNELVVRMHDVNAVLYLEKETSWESYVKELLPDNDVTFTYGTGHWVTIRID